MIVRPIKTKLIKPGSDKLLELLDDSIGGIEEGSVLAVTSKIVSLCQNRIVDSSTTTKEELIKGEASRWLDGSHNKYGVWLTIIDNKLVPTAGIDESNVGGGYLLWPKNVQLVANEIREYFVAKYTLKKFGVVVTDSTTRPLVWGTGGISIAHSGFKSLNDYRGKKDLFGEEFKVSQSGVAYGLAAAAVLTMGEGTEQTPLALISDLPFVQFQDRNPAEGELGDLKISPEEDLFHALLNSADWQSR